MEFTILERLMLQSILPQKGDMVTLKIVQDLRSDFAFSEEEIADHDIANNDDRITWSKESFEYVKDIKVGPKAMSLIVTELETRDKEGILTAEFISLYDKVMETTE